MAEPITLPNNPKMEMAVIGGMLMDMSTAKLVLTRMNSDWFYTDKNKAVYQVIKAKVEAGITPDVILLLQWLTAAGILAEVGGQAYLVECMEQCGMCSQVESYINVLRGLHLDRAIVAAVYSVQREPSAENIEKLRQRSVDRDSVDTGGLINIKDCGEVIMNMTNPRQKGLYNIFPKIMEKLREFHNGGEGGNIMVIAARPGVGKTVMATQILSSFTQEYKDDPGLYFSTEMSYEESLMRIMAPMTHVPGWKFRKRVFNKEDIELIVKAASELTERKIHLCDKPSPTLADIRAGIIRTKCKLVIIDYIQRLNLEIGPKSSRPEAIGNMMMGIKNTCRDLNCFAIILSQMDRETDHLTGKARPQLADLKGSGDIEQEADSVLLLWRHNKKDKETKRPTVPDVDNIRPIEAIMAKNRHGTSDVSVQLIFDEKFIEFREYNTDEALKVGQMVKPEKKQEDKNGTDTKGIKPEFGGTEDPDEEATF